MYDPNAAWSMLEDVKKLSSTIRDGIFFECLETYILYSYRYNEETNQFESENLQSLAEALADASPNTEANYEGRPDKLNEYAKRLIKLIDDCGTKQKARYIASLTRALLSKQIDRQPGESRLKPFQNQHLEEFSVIVFRLPPLVVVVGDVEIGTRVSPTASHHIDGLHTLR